MIMDISEELLVIRVDFPEQNMTVPSCYRIYFTWNAKTKEGRYFPIETTKDREAKLLGEMNDTIQHVSYGVAPVESASGNSKTYQLIRQSFWILVRTDRNPEGYFYAEMGHNAKLLVNVLR